MAATGERLKALQGNLPALSRAFLVIPVKACKPFKSEKLGGNAGLFSS
jgi:hypothetical protein